MACLMARRPRKKEETRFFTHAHRIRIIVLIMWRKRTLGELVIIRRGYCSSTLVDQITIDDNRRAAHGYYLE